MTDMESPHSRSSVSATSSRSFAAPLSDRQVKELTGAFNKFDLDKDGRITRSELGAVLSQLGFQCTASDIDVMVKEADMDGDGCIDLEEFLQINAAAEAMNGAEDPAALEEVFEVFDKDKNGVICAEELHSVLCALSEEGETLTVEDCRKMIQKVDANGDGVVDFSEFREMMSRKDVLPCP